METSLKIETKIYDHGIIEQVTKGGIGSIRDEYVRTVIRTQDQQIRDALISLGWTPPPNAIIQGPRSGRWNGGLCAILHKVKNLFAHKHRWIDSGWNQWSIATEQHCKCGVYRHHLWDDVKGAGVSWRDGRHPKAHNVELTGRAKTPKTKT